jgi:ATP-dependent Lon protease
LFFRERRTDAERPRTWPLLPLREVVVFPHQPMSLIVGRPRSVAAVAAASRHDREVLLVAQKDGEAPDPKPEDIYGFGTIATVEQTLHLPDGNTRILVEGRRRARILRYVENSEHYEVELEEFEPGAHEASVEVQALVRTVRGAFERYAKLNRAIPPEVVLTVNALEDPDRLADTLVATLSFKLPERQELLETVDPGVRLERV